MEIKSFDFLPDDAKRIREAVFMQEQGFKNEFDDIDGIAVHLVGFENGEAAATCRIFAENGEYILGRVAVMKELRGRGFGSEIITQAEKEVIKRGGKSLSAHSQCRIREFYESLGYECFGEIDYDEYCPHIWMKKQLQ